MGLQEHIVQAWAFYEIDLLSLSPQNFCSSYIFGKN